MTTKSVNFERKDGVAILTLDRPDVLNSFNEEMGKTLKNHLLSVAADPDVRAVLITGSGRGFSAGQDLSEVKPLSDGTPPNLGEKVRDCYNPIIKAIREMPKPVIAAVNGIAAGAGANIALACDIVIASSNASFVQSFANVGLIADSGGTFFLPRLIGMGRAAALMMTCEKVSAAEAERIGMIYKVVELEALMEKSLEMATKLSLLPTEGLAMTKVLLGESYANTLADQLQLEEEAQEFLGRTHDYSEGVNAFLQKRTPNFKGR